MKAENWASSPPPDVGSSIAKYVFKLIKCRKRTRKQKVFPVKP